MGKTGILIVLFSLMLLLCVATPVKADGIIIPPPCPELGCPPPPCFEGWCPPPRPISQLVIRSHVVDVEINDPIAVTKVDQVFHNPNDYPIEGIYIFPLPAGAVVSDFKLWMDGKPVEGKVLSADEARRTYEDIVAQMRDPALLEYVGQGAVQASIFPIAPGEDRRIQLEYQQVLQNEGGLVRYVYPLNTEKFSLEPLEQVAVRVNIQSRQSLRAVYSPSHPIDVVQTGPTRATAGWEAKDVLPDQDFALFYSIGETEAFHLLTYRDPGDPTDPYGYFLLMLAPSPESAAEPLPRDVILVLDRSGSMEGEKFLQAQQALRYVLGKLRPEDRFALMTFSTSVEKYAPGLRSSAEVPDALAWVDRLSAGGSTNINQALLDAAALADSERPVYVIFLTDGLPTVGEIDSNRILANLSNIPDGVRLYTFGVGYDVDTFLLDSLSSEHHGLSSYVRPDESLDQAVQAFYERISTPVMTDLQIDYGAANVFDVYPQPLPDLFAGRQTIVVGRYRESGRQNVVLRGEMNGQSVAMNFNQQTFTADSREDSQVLSAIPSLWAARKIGYLLAQVRLNGPDEETIQQIVRLSIRYGIITPYTSYLVTEDTPLGQEAQEKIAADAFSNAQSTPSEVTGQGAVERAAQEGDLQSAEAAPSLGSDLSSMVRAVKGRTFVLQTGEWVDTAYDPQVMPVTEIPFLSEEYYRLVNTRGDVAAGLALGERVLIVVDGTAYRVVTGQPSSVLTATPEPGITLEPTNPKETPVVPDPLTATPGQSSPPARTLCGSPLVVVFVWIGVMIWKKKIAG